MVIKWVHNHGFLCTVSHLITFVKRVRENNYKKKIWGFWTYLEYNYLLKSTHTIGTIREEKKNAETSGIREDEVHI